MNENRIEELIRICQDEAQKSVDSGNPPFGCVITDIAGNVVAQDYNTQNSDSDPTAHAELKALRQLGKKLGTRHFDDYIMFANASSCSMCMSGCIKAHITRYYYGALPERSMDPWLPMEDVASNSKLKIEIHGPILGEECATQIARGRKLL